MFAPITAPTYIQTVHGLSYKVVRTSQREENEDPQQSQKSNRIEPKSNSQSGKQDDGSQFA